MAVHTIKKGLDLPITGDPVQKAEACLKPRRVAVIADDFVGMKPTMQVQVGDRVKRGQLLFDDKKMPGVRHTAPGSGVIQAINRGARRALQSVTIDLTETERSGKPADDDFQPFASHNGKPPADLSAEEIRALLLESGLWTALRARPFGRVADSEATPQSLFVTAMTTDPLAALVDVALTGNEADFQAGVQIVAKLTEGKTYVCQAPGAKIPEVAGESIQVEEFQGPHPAGLVGTHIHILAPATLARVAWYLDYQDVVAIGKLFATGRLDVGRVVALSGPTVNKPRLLKTRIGAAIDDLVEGELAEGENRVVSGSVLSGRAAAGEIHGYLGRYHLQITALAEGRERELLGWAMPGLNKFSITGAFLSSFLPKKKIAFTTTANGSGRAMIPIGSYERVMPLDIMPTFLLRSLAMDDVVKAEQLGCLELVEEDLALCTFVCPGKTDFGSILRRNLTIIEKEG